MEAVGSPLTNKYAEGLPGKRYYGGCWAVDEVENLARERVKRLFGAGYANVQPHSGAQANYAAISAFADPGDTIMNSKMNGLGIVAGASAAALAASVIAPTTALAESTTGADLLIPKPAEFVPALIAFVVIWVIMRVALAGLTTAEFFRDQGQDVLLFIDNIFRFSQAGSEVSALLGRMERLTKYLEHQGVSIS